MSSHDVSVLAGEIGSSSRTKKLNIMLDEIDRAVSEARDTENRDVEVITVSSAYLATELNYSQSTIVRNGFPDFFKRYYESTAYVENKGLRINVDKWVEERKEQREKLAEKNGSDSSD